MIFYAFWSLVLRYKKSSGRRLTVITAVTASVFLCLMMEGLPHYLPRRSAIDLAPEMKLLRENTTSSVPTLPDTPSIPVKPPSGWCRRYPVKSKKEIPCGMKSM